MTAPARTLVIGGASGIGAACVEALTGAGGAVLCADLREPPPDLPLEAAVTVDVRDAGAVRAAVSGLADGREVSGVVYAAGVGHVAPLPDITPERWALIVDVNLTGAFNVLRAVVPVLADGAGIVLISSIDAASPVSGLAHYCAAKAGLEALGRSAALELAPRGIRANVVAPGPVRTPLLNATLEDPQHEEAFTSRAPLGTIATPEQIADGVLFLLSPAAAQITGVRLPIDGGMSLREHPSMLTITEQGPT